MGKNEMSCNMGMNSMAVKSVTVSVWVGMAEGTIEDKQGHDWHHRCCCSHGRC